MIAMMLLAGGCGGGTQAVGSGAQAEGSGAQEPGAGAQAEATVTQAPETESDQDKGETTPRTPDSEANEQTPVYADEIKDGYIL